MVTYNVTLTADGYPSVNLGSMLNELSLTSGSSDGIEQPNPSNLSVTFLGSPSLSGTTYPASWWLGKAITVRIQPSDTTDYILWNGYVSNASIEALTPDGSSLLVSIGAYSDMQILQQQTINLDGSGGLNISDRIAAVNDAASALLWSEMDGTTNWGSIPSSYTWSNIDTIRPSINVIYVSAVPSPISSTLPWYYAGTTDALSYFQLLATSCNSWFYEKAKNGYGLYWQKWRSSGSPAGTTLDLSTVGLSQSLRADIDVSRLSNEITFTPYDPSLAPFPTTVGDIASIQQYGYRPQSYEIENYVYADMANNILYRYSQPYTSLSTVDIVVDLLPAASKVDFMFAGANNRYAFTNVPTAFGGNDEYEVRGVNLTLQYETAVATVTVVPSKFWAQYTAWWRVDSTSTWATYATASTKWQDII